MRRRWLQNSLLVLFGIGMAGVIALIARPYLLPQAAPAHDAPCQPASIELLTLLKQVVIDWRDPCAEFYWRPEPTDEFHVRVRLNNFGLHAPPYTLGKPEGVFRILVVGDSFPQGMQVNMEETFPFLLQQQLGAGYEVINLSIDAFGTDRELLTYALLGWQFQPDLVLLAVYPGNDVQDNQIDLEARRYGYRLGRPFFTVENGDLTLHHSVLLDSALYPEAAAYQWLTGLQAEQADTPPEDPPQRPRVTGTNPYTLEYPVELGVYLPEDDHWRAAWAITEALLLEFRQVVSLSGVPFVAVIIPDRRAVHDGDWAVTVAQYDDTLSDLRDADPLAAGTRLEDFLAQESIPALNVTGALRAWVAAHPDGRLYYPGDGHFTPEGHAVTAEALAGWLQANGLAGD